MNEWMVPVYIECRHGCGACQNGMSFVFGVHLWRCFNCGKNTRIEIKSMGGMPMDPYTVSITKSDTP